MKGFERNVWDWYQIGGRWTQTLAPMTKEFEEIIKPVEFWMSVFPAVFIDIIAPLALAISMFLKREDNDKRRI